MSDGNALYPHEQGVGGGPPMCELCEEPIEPADLVEWHESPSRDAPVTARTHRECGLRMAIGGIGHLTDHDFWCNQMHDPDAGLSYRESARRVMAWMEQRR